jgi:hypothetical protein
MWAKKILVLIRTSAIAMVIACCVSSCEEQDSEGLRFVNKSNQKSMVAKGLVIVTHGWIEKGKGSWPEDMAAAIYNRVQPDNWLCGYFDWSKEAKTINPTDAAKYARDVAGPKLAKEIIELGDDFQHIHLIGHSSGCWAVSEAAKILAGRTKADIHLTFFDAYIPSFWQECSLGDIRTAADSNCWVDHYYTRDYTLGFTEQNLSNAHNVDVTSIDQLLKDHKFPWKWYYASITGKYPKGTLLDNSKLALTAEGIEYGFARSREAGGSYGWGRSLKLPMGNAAVKFAKP